MSRFEGVTDYEKILKMAFPRSDIFVSVAAVLDFEIEPFKGKIERQNQNTLSLNVKATPDFVAWAVQNKHASQRIVAFALESGSWPEVIERAKRNFFERALMRLL